MTSSGAVRRWRLSAVTAAAYHARSGLPGSRRIVEAYASSDEQARTGSDDIGHGSAG
jgi:hypothetical protein